MRSSKKKINKPCNLERRVKIAKHYDRKEGGKSGGIEEENS